jgi:hypothetical protein
MLEGEPGSPWKSTAELDDETAGIDPDVMLPAKLQLIGHAADLEFAAAPIPQTKSAPAEGNGELRNPSRDELLLHIARNARKRKDYDESAKFYRRTMELTKGQVDVQLEFAEMLAEAGRTAELKTQLEKIERESPPKTDVERKRLAKLKNPEGNKAAMPTPPAPLAPPKSPTIPVTAPVGQAAKASAKTNSPKESQGTAAKKLEAPSKLSSSGPTKQTDAPPKPVAVKNNKKSFDSLDPPAAPTPPTAATVDVAKKADAPKDEFAATQPFFRRRSKISNGRSRPIQAIRRRNSALLG